MNSLEEQLDYLNYQAEIRKAKQGFNISVMQNPDRKFSFCMCQTEDFINYSDNQRATRAAYISTWLIGFNLTSYFNQHLYHKYKFVSVMTHGDASNCSASWLASPRSEKNKTFYDYELMWDYFERALFVLKNESPNHLWIYQKILRCIKDVTDDDSRNCLRAALDYVYPEEARIIEADYKTFIHKKN